MYKKIILFIPHSSDNINNSKWDNDELFQQELNTWTDWHTNTIFSANIPNVKSIVVPFSRYFSDCERLINDPLESTGNGIYYTHGHNGVNRIISDIEKTNALNVYNEYNNLLINESKGNSLVIDCHSFPSILNNDIDVCIGFNNDETKPSQYVLDLIYETFKQFGYNVQFNLPYSNAKCGAVGSHSVMIELNKKIYMNENTLKRDVSAYKIRNALIDLYRNLL